MELAPTSNLIDSHTLHLFQNPSFQDNYIIRCNFCKCLLFELQKIQSLLIWNTCRYIVFDIEKFIPNTILISTTERVEMSGIIAHNIYVNVSCAACKQKIGLIVRAPNFKCVILKNKLLISNQSVQCMQMKNKTIKYFSLNPAFCSDAFVDMTYAVSNNKKTSQEPREPNAEDQQKQIQNPDKNENPVDQQSQIEYLKQQKVLKQQLQSGINAFREAIFKMENRILTIEGVCCRYDKVIKTMFEKLKMQPPKFPQFAKK